MASSKNGEYQLDTINEVHANTQDYTQEEGPRWTPDEVTETTSTVEYQEGAGAIGGPSSVNEIREIQDDLITKYNFQDGGAPVPPVPPVPTGMTVHLSIESYSPELLPVCGSLSKTIVTNIPEGALVCGSFSYEEGTKLIIYTGDISEEPEIIDMVTVSCDEGFGVYEWRYLDGDEWNSISTKTEVFDGMQIRVTTRPVPHHSVIAGVWNETLNQWGGGTLNQIAINDIPDWGSTYYWNNSYGSDLTIRDRNLEEIGRFHVEREYSYSLRCWEVYDPNNPGEGWQPIEDIHPGEVSDLMQFRAVVYLDQ